MAADFNKVITTEMYATLLATVTDLVKDMVKGLDPALALGTLNIPTNALRWNSANGYWEKYNGTVWAALASSYAINISGSAAKWATGRTITLTGDATGTSGAFDGSAALSFAVTLATVTAAKGGTGQTAYTVGDLLYASGASALSKLADTATGNALLSGGVGAAPSWGKVGLTTHVSGTLPIANGGTSATTAANARTQLGLAIGIDVVGIASKDATGGVPGLTLFKINFRNALNTFTSFFTNANTAARTYTFQDRDGTIADNTDLAGKASLSGATFTGPVLGTRINGGKVTVASAATPDIFGAAGQFIDYTGTATATGFAAAAAAGMEVELYCAGECKFTAGANLLIEGIPSGSTVTMAAGATVKIRAVTTTQFKMTYSVSGTFTATGTGFSGTPPAITARYTVVNGCVSLFMPSSIGGTSNATTFTITGLPAAIAPVISAPRTGTLEAQNNTAVARAVASINGNIITLFCNGWNGAWTASGTKALYSEELRYTLN